MQRPIPTHLIIPTLILLSSVLAVGLGGCGVKPGKVTPPAGSEHSPFPRTYPAP